MDEPFRLRLLSDIHLSLSDFTPPAAEADLVVLAGDIGRGCRGLAWAARCFPTTPVIYLAGNHEYYHGEIGAINRDLKAFAEAENRQRGEARLSVLENEALEWRSPGRRAVSFLGATLWTDYAIDAAGADDVARAMAAAEAGIRDHQVIAIEPWGRFRPEHALALNRQSVAWLEGELARPFAGTTVVVTHHLPSPKSVAERFRGSPLTPAFASDLDRLVVQADLWLHGHTHDNFDYRLGPCRVVCNPRGYVREVAPGQWSVENPDFIPDLVLAA